LSGAEGEFGLASNPSATNNGSMVISGHVKNGVIVLQGDSRLPEGAVVTVTYPADVHTPAQEKKRRIQVPLVRTGEPGSIELTAERIAEIMDDDDVPARH
jgi:hypothetical protein